MTSTTLYKQGHDGLRVWKAAIYHSTIGRHSLIIEHGLQGGKMQQEEITHTQYIHAEIEYEKRIQYKLERQGYTRAVPDYVPDLPMLAVQYEEHKDSLPDIVMVQPKLNGIRGLATNEETRSRRNEEITSCPHIKNALKDLPKKIKLDGELYCHGLSFQKHLSLIKRHHPLNETLRKIKYHVFDLVDTGLPFKLRYAKLCHFIPLLNSPLIKIVPTIYAKKEELEASKDEYKDYEGRMIRDPDGLYEPNKRSPTLQKDPWVLHDEFQVLDIKAAKSGREKGAAIFICKANGKEFSVRPAMPLERRRYIFAFKDQFIGDWTRIKYKSLSEDGLPVPPIAEGLRKEREQLQ